MHYIKQTHLAEIHCNTQPQAFSYFSKTFIFIVKTKM